VKLFTPGELTVHSGPAEVARTTRALRQAGRRIALVPTMGALHDGHRELIRRAKRLPGTTIVVSIFVNPLQFGPDEDLSRYPRPFEADLEACREEGVELVFHPEVEQMYTSGERQITVDPGPLAGQLEGASRPGHFAGVLTVVNKLFNIVRPDFAFFGEKDYQQLVLVRRMVADFDHEVKVVGVPIVREETGLARSSRNVYLSDEQRAAALALSAALSAGQHAGPFGPDAVLAAADAVLNTQSGLETDYLELRAEDLSPVTGPCRARLLVAARVGATRLIDNTAVLLGGGEGE
jgi:pantoate--beta-alanine ligase